MVRRMSYVLDAAPPNRQRDLRVAAHHEDAKRALNACNIYMEVRLVFSRLTARKE